MLFLKGVISTLCHSILFLFSDLKTENEVHLLHSFLSHHICILFSFCSCRFASLFKFLVGWHWRFGFNKKKPQMYKKMTQIFQSYLEAEEDYIRVLKIFVFNMYWKKKKAFQSSLQEVRIPDSHYCEFVANELCDMHIISPLWVSFFPIHSERLAQGTENVFQN